MADAIENTGNKFEPEPSVDTSQNKDVFQNEFENEKTDSANLGRTFSGDEPGRSDVLRKAKLYPYKPVKFGADYGGVGFNNSILYNRYQPYQGGQGPINLSSGSDLNALIRLGTYELLEDVRITGAFKIGTNLKDNEWLMQYRNYKRRIDWGGTYYRNVLNGGNGRLYTNLYQAYVAYPFDKSRRVSIDFGLRSDRTVFFTDINNSNSLKAPDIKQKWVTTHVEYVYDNSLNPTQNIWNGLRYKLYFDWNTDISKQESNSGKFNFNWGADARYYYPIYRNFIWAARAAGEFSWGNQKTIYYLGGMDGWIAPSFNHNNPPAPDNDYAFQSLAVNMRGFKQNVANGNNSIVLNSEFRLPVFTTLFSRPINNAFLRNFQLVQFIDLGSAWNGKYNGLKRPQTIVGDPPIQVLSKVGGLGPFAGGYGFGARSTILGYFLKFDVAWPMNGFFKVEPELYVSLGLDF